MTRNAQARGGFRSKAADAGKASALQGVLAAAARETLAGDHAKAASVFINHLATDPACSDAWTGLGAALKRQGNLVSAESTYQTAITLHPAVAANHFGLAEVLRRGRRLAPALETCERGLALNPAIGEGHIVRAAIRKDMGDADGAVADLRLIIASNPQLATIHALLGDVLTAFNRFTEAAQAFEEAIRLDPNHVAFHQKLMHVQTRLHFREGAIGQAERLVALAPRDANAYRVLATLHEKAGNSREAFAMYQKAVEIDPHFAQAYSDLGCFVLSENKIALAISVFRVALLLAPNSAVCCHNLGVALRMNGLLEEAAYSFRKALALNPRYLKSRAELCSLRQHFCDWHGLAGEQESIFTEFAAGGPCVPPFFFLTFPRIDPERTRLASRRWAQTQRERCTIPAFPARPIDMTRPRLRIGYVSSDFYTHATAMLVADMFETHDKARFEIFGYSFGPHDESALRARIIGACDTFRDFADVSSIEAARRINKDEIDILIDLKGYTQGAHSELFVARPAPLQVNFLGYPATMGGDFMDYAIVDKVLVPDDHAPFYDESLVYLPDSYQPNDRKRSVAPATPSRESAGLPARAFVFCCFNNPYKITEEVFDVWMGILNQTPGSVLWLFEKNGLVVDNLQREAEARGIARERLVFSPRMAPPDHIARLKLADLFLDTVPYNAHTTASEALWVGLPVLTCMGNTFASRVAASLLHAASLPELITDSLEAYAAKAVAIAHDPREAARLKSVLQATRDTMPLFDTPRYVRNFEAALLEMATRQAAGEPPRSFAV